MALRVWLPLNGNIENKGLDTDCKSEGTITYSGGKIGQALYMETASTSNGIYAPKQEKQVFTISLWFKAPGYTGTRRDLCNEGRDYNTLGWRVGLNAKENTLTITGAGSGGTYTQSFVPDTWYHIAFSRDESKNVYIYINGVLVSTKTDTGDLNYSESNGYINIGRFGYGSGNSKLYPYQGYLNDFRYYDECLSPKQIKEISKGLITHYKMSNYGINDNLATNNPLVNSGATSISYDRYTHTYTIVSPVGESTWGYGLKIGTTDKCLIPWNSDYRFSFEVWVPTEHEIRVDYNNYANIGSSWNGNDNDLTSARYQDYARTVPGQTWTKLIFGSKNAHTGNTDHVDIYEVSNIGLRTMNDTEPVTWYLRNFKFELGDTATEYVSHDYKSTEFIIQDCSGYGYNGVKTGTLTSNLNSPRYDNSMAFSSAIVNSPSCAVLANSKDFTINGWFYHVSGTNYYASAESYNTSVCLENGRFFVYPASGGAYVGNWSAIDNVWQMLTLVHDCTAKTLTLYVDGVQRAQITTNGTVYPNNTLNIGGRQNTAGYTGSISDFRIYVTALSAEDIKELYQTSAIVDNQGNSYAYEFKEE